MCGGLGGATGGCGRGGSGLAAVAQRGQHPPVLCSECLRSAGRAAAPVQRAHATLQLLRAPECRVAPRDSIVVVSGSLLFIISSSRSIINISGGQQEEVAAAASVGSRAAGGGAASRGALPRIQTHHECPVAAGQAATGGEKEQS